MFHTLTVTLKADLLFVNKCFIFIYFILTANETYKINC